MDVRRLARVLKATLARHAGRHGFKCVDMAEAHPDDPRPALTALGEIVTITPHESPLEK